jgi:hypothetical protein
MIDNTTVKHRAEWEARRAGMERREVKQTPDKLHHRRHWFFFEHLLDIFGIFLRIIGLYSRGRRNALDIELSEQEVWFDGLPSAFDGYRIMQISDPHIDAMAELPSRIAEIARRTQVDLCALTGDYRYKVTGDSDILRDGLGQVISAVNSKDGTFAILGNHDSADMLPLLEDHGASVLINQTITLTRGDDAIHVTGVDDPHYYFTDAATDALESAPGGFRIALVHSPELGPQASAAGYDFYLCGHTHGGQVCLPGGRAVFTHSGGFRAFSQGHWRTGRMQGYTSRGAGVSGLPVRFNCRGEITVFTLRRKPR